MHGTRSIPPTTILDDATGAAGIDNRYSAVGGFGPAAYFADSSAKCDEYR